jgi:signal transduction histidine kinase
MRQAVEARQLVKEVQAGNGAQSRSELAIPLVLRNQVIGVLGVKREKTPVWADEEIAAVEAVAGQVARALDNARLSKEQEKTIVQLKELDRLKSEFLTSMSHELRTPLNSIIGFADVLLQGIDGDLPDLAMNDIQLIYNSGHHLLALINDVLDLSKIEADRMELVLEDVCMADAVSDVLASTSSLLKDKSVEIIANVEPDLPLVKADRLRLSQILINLVSNATKFTAEGSITIHAHVSADDENKMRVGVIDTGIGIPPDKQETVFARFRQADSSTTRKYGGTGLGLAICKRLVEMHGGEIGIISEVGQGAEFYFTIPLSNT